MNKRVLYFNFISVFVALLLMSIVSFFAIYQNNLSKSKRQIENYLNVTVSLYETYGDTYEADPSSLNKYLKSLDEDLRLTILSSNGEVLYDSASNTTEPHGDRDEFLNQNKVFIRYSNTLGQRMMYIASKPTNYDIVIRLALPLGNINKDNLFFLIILLHVLLIYILVVVGSIFYYKRALKPFTDSLNELAKLAGGPKNYAIDDPKLLSMQVNEIKETLNKNLDIIKDERNKLSTILNVMKTGVLVLDNDKVIHANKTVIDYFNLDSIVALELFMDSRLKGKIDYDISTSFIETINEKDYLFEVEPYKSTWLKKGLIISVIDITEEIKLEKTKKEFFQNASHELKSPLTIIKGNLELITEGISDNVEEILLKTISEIDSMNALINQMLDVSILESKEIKKPSSYLIKDFINSILDDYKVKIKEKKLHLKVSLDDSTALIEEKDLHMLLNNLIDNAIKYNKKMGSLIITLKNQKLIIKDTGLGINKAEINRIYERFYRGSDETIKKISGSGLGLAIVKHICQTYNIKITLNSIENQETQFTLIFPK
ncbi:MAG: HAMP domain-containing histidine kinase [Acholeplasmataceae bacterium]|nr:HAMP domain-containing histidine kinase [Acholeplasmataceae bacterium]